MFLLCECGKMVYYLGKDCPYCGREIDLAFEHEDKEGFAEKSRDKQMRLFEC